MTLWGTYAEIVQKYMSTYTSSPVVVALQWCRVKEYKNELTLTNSMYATRVFVNAEIPKIRTFVNGPEMNDCVGPAIGIAPLDNVPQNSLTGGGTFQGLPISEINDIFYLTDKSLACIIATFLCVNNDRLWYDEACKRCSRKVTSGGAFFHCDRSDLSSSSPVVRYEISVI